MNILVLYHSNTGHTQKMAGFVAEGARSIEDVELRVLSVSEAKPADVLWCEGMALGSPTNIGVLSWQMKKFWDHDLLSHWMKLDGKIGCAFSSSGGYGGGSELTCQSLMTVMMNYGFLCFGVPDYVDAKNTLHYGAIAAKDPRADTEQEACRVLGKRLAEWVGFMYHGRKNLHPCLRERFVPKA